MTESGAKALLGLAQDDFACPICMSMYRDPFVTDCGHSFCFQCITTHLINKKSCPCCSTYVTTEKIHANFVLHKVVDKVSKANVVRKLTAPDMVVQLISEDRARLKLEDVNKLLHLLGERKRLLQQQDAESNLQLLLQFLRHSRQEKAQQLLSLQAELQLLESDIKQVAGRKEVAPSPEPAQAPQLPSMTPDTAGVGKSNLVHAGNNQTASHSSSSAAVSGLLPSALLPGHEANQPATAAASILSKCLPVQSSSGQLPPHTAAPALAPCTTDGSMSRASNGYLMITNPYVGQPIPCSASGSARLPTAISAPDAAPAVASTSATAAPAHPVAPPTQLGANGSMHIHPRHLAFQHFQQQQAALQQRQQQPVNGHGLASAHSLDSTDADALDRMDRAASLASAQSDAIRARRRRLLSQFEDLQQCYLRLRNPKKRPAQPLKLPQLSANKQQALDQPAKRIKQEPDMGVQPPSDSAGSHPLGGAHPGEPDSINQAQDKQQDGCYTAAPQNGIGGAHSDGAGMPAHSHPAGRASSNGHADPEKGWSHKGFPDKGPSENGYRQNSVAESGKGGMAGNSQHLSDQQHATAKVVGPADEEGLAEFSRMLSVFTHCARLKVIAQLPRTSNAHCSNILSSIEFDRDGQIFATAGVSKRISMYDYSVVMACPNAESHAPSQELVTRSKLSCLSWNKYLRTYLASSDYEGVVHVWDIATGQNVVEYEAHEKRIWSVDFCQSDPTLLMSGSDDGMVKVWSSNQAASVAEIDIKANVCCAKYNPESMYKVAVGAADHTVHTYDLRKADKAVHVFRGHRKAVSYVRYLNGNELVSASTDSTLRLWDTQSCVNTRVFNGHSNEKNFVGLSISDDFVACGSETNEVFVYYKAMSKAVCRRLFSTPAEVARHAQNQDPSQFISAVCWKPESQVLLSANSQGTIKVMQVTS